MLMFIFCGGQFHPTTSVHKMLSEVALVALQGLTGKLWFEREK